MMNILIFMNYIKLIFKTFFLAIARTSLLLLQLLLVLVSETEIECPIYFCKRVMFIIKVKFVKYFYILDIHEANNPAKFKDNQSKCVVDDLTSRNGDIHTSTHIPTSGQFVEIIDFRKLKNFQQHKSSYEEATLMLIINLIYVFVLTTNIFFVNKNIKLCFIA